MSRLTTEEFIVKAKRIHGNKFSYTKTKYVNSETNLTIICPIHGDFSTKPFIHLYGSDCPKCAVIPGRPPKTNEERFWKLVKSGNPDECWEWQGSKGKGGYGRFNKYNRLKNSHIYAHKFSYELHNGPVPDGLLVLHKCDNPGCVNPNHLWLGTYRDNCLDMINKGRAKIGGKPYDPTKKRDSDH